jgi:outer membrane protein TolC
MAICEVLPLAQAQSTMLRNNLDIAIADQQIEKKQLEMRETKSGWFPSLDAVASYNQLTDKTSNTMKISPLSAGPSTFVIPYSDHKAELGADISYPLTAAFVNIYQVHYKNLIYKAAQIQKQSLVSMLSYKLAATYLLWSFSYGQADVQKALMTQLEQSVDQMKNRYAKGLSASSSVYDAQARFDAATVDLISFQNKTDSLKLELMNILQSNDSTMTPENFSFKLDSLGIAALDTLSLDTTRSELFTSDVIRNQLQLFDKILFAQRYPNIVAVAGYRYGQPGLQMGKNDFMSYGQVGIQCKLNLFDGFRVSSQQAQNKMQMAMTQTQKLQQKNTWQMQLENAKLQLKHTQMQKRATLTSKKAADAFLADAKNNLAAGTITSSEYLNAQVAQAKADLAIKQAEFMESMGVLQVYYAAGKELIFNTK